MLCSGHLRAIVAAAAILALALPGQAAAGPRPEDHAITAAGGITLDGTTIVVRGDIHANEDVVLQGTIRVEGAVEARRRIVATSGVLAARFTGGAAPSAILGVDLGALRARAQRVFDGDRRFQGVQVLPGITYVQGSAVIDGVLIGPGILVAERIIHVRSAGVFANTVDLVAGERLVVTGMQITLQGMLHSNGVVEINGGHIGISGLLTGRSVVIRGTHITITAAPALAGLLRSLPLPAPTAVVKPEILSPRPGEALPGATAVVVNGRAPAGAAVRVAVRNQSTGREVSRDAAANADGRFMVIVPLPDDVPGPHRITAVVVGLAGRVSEAATVEVFIRESP